jgi:sortase A
MKKTTIQLTLSVALAALLCAPFFASAGDKTVIGSISIPSLNAKGTIVETSTITGLGADLWHRGPGEPGSDIYQNVVLAGHRSSKFSKQVPFYNLPLMKKGDQVVLNWKGETYTYEVYETKIVAPTDISIEFNTNEPILTMYTCVYNFNAKNRFMVRAKLVKDTPAVSVN